MQKKNRKKQTDNRVVNGRDCLSCKYHCFNFTFQDWIRTVEKKTANYDCALSLTTVARHFIRRCTQLHTRYTSNE